MGPRSPDYVVYRPLALASPPSLTVLETLEKESEAEVEFRNEDSAICQSL